MRTRDDAHACMRYDAIIAQIVDSLQQSEKSYIIRDSAGRLREKHRDGLPKISAAKMPAPYFRLRLSSFAPHCHYFTYELII